MCNFSRMCPGQDFYITLIQSSLPRKRIENIRNWCHSQIGLHTQTKPNPVDILGNIEILTKMRPGKMARMVTLLQQHLPYYCRRYTVYRTPLTRLEWKMKSSAVVRTCLHMSKGVFRSLACKHQTTDSSNLLSCCLCSSEFWLFCSKSRICFGEMYWSESIHFN